MYYSILFVFYSFQGVITDDSDIWLFGARTVYKNFFDKKSHVLRYTAPDIRYYFGK
jgi:XPG I-region.